MGKDFSTNPDVLAVYKNMVAAIPGIELKGKTHPYLSMNGNMYSAISKDHIIGIRLSKADCEEYLAKYDTGLFEPFPGFFQKLYVPVPQTMHHDTRTLRAWFRKSHANACTLKPKPTTKKSKA